jgi:hypothetical protein
LEKSVVLLVIATAMARLELALKERFKGATIELNPDILHSREARIPKEDRIIERRNSALTQASSWRSHWRGEIHARTRRTDF